MNIDLEYIDNGFTVSFMPVSSHGVKVWNELYEQGGSVIFSIHLKSVVSQLRRAGYIVRKAKRVKDSTDKLYDNLKELKS